MLGKVLDTIKRTNSKEAMPIAEMSVEEDNISSDYGIS